MIVVAFFGDFCKFGWIFIEFQEKLRNFKELARKLLELWM